MSRSEITIPSSSGEEAKYAEQRPADEGANEAHAEIPQEAEALAFPCDEKTRKAAADQPDDDPPRPE